MNITYNITAVFAALSIFMAHTFSFSN